MKYVGVISQTNGDQTHEMKDLIKPTKWLSKRLASVHLNRYYTHTYLKRSINSKLTHLLCTSPTNDK